LKKNIIILTSGLSGSSVLAALIAQDGYWTGESTVKKSDYDTWENQELVELNKQLLRDIGFVHDWTMHFDAAWPEWVFEKASRLNPQPYREFVERCSSHTPWLWKDPRLWLTYRYWAQFLTEENLCYLCIHRDPWQSWISTTLRRQIQTFSHARKYESGIRQSILTGLNEIQRPYLDLMYEDLIVKPGETIQLINETVGSGLAVQDFVRIFKGRLYKKQHGFPGMVKAIAIYLKNYSQRVA